MRRIGILGGGQLGMLLAQSIIRLGAEALIYDPESEAPASRTVKSSVHANWQDKKSLEKFLSSCDQVTYEFENVPYASLAGLNHNTPILPSLDVLRITQNRAAEKEFLQCNNLPHVPYFIADNISSLEKQIDQLSFPIIIKSTTGGYDGKAQVFLQKKEDFQKTISKSEKGLPNFPVIAEQAIDLYMEVSCITAHSAKGEKIVFPVFQNIHANHILDTTVVPADIPADISTAVQDLAHQATDKLGVVGILCTEFFISRKKTGTKSAFNLGEFDLYINEFAPRPHNSGHITISSCSLNQFDALARILLDVPLSQPLLSKVGYFCMANLLGDIWINQGTTSGDKINLSGLANCQEPFELILYGKELASPGRKMGHLISHAENAQKATERALKLREKLKNSACLK
jgi:5-(carboxyamino)imidazole ribonucleotide synthase